MKGIKTQHKGRNIIKTIPSEFSYIGEFEKELSMGYIIQKGGCGVGGTHSEIKSARHSVIVVPYSKLITEKKQKHKNIICVMGGVKEREIAHEINICNEPVKIMVTYDSLHKVIGAILKVGMLDKFNFLIDEYHVLLIDASFRESAIGMLLDIIPELSRVSFMSATPIPRKFIPATLKSFPSITYKWENTVPCDVAMINTDNYLKSLKRFIKGHKGGTNLHIFLNSVSDIARILKDMDIRPEDVSVICSENEESNNQSKLGEEYVISSNIGDPSKYNFYTSIAFLGVDIDDSKGETVVIASNKTMSLRIEPSMVFTQIVGRLRDKTASRRVVTLISDVSINSDRAYESYVEFKKGFQGRYRSIKRGVDVWNNKSEMWKNTNSFVDAVGGDKANLCSMRPDKSMYLDMIKLAAFYFGEHLKYDVYKNPVSFLRSLESSGFNIISKTSDFTKKDDTIKKGTNIKFKDAYNEYCCIMEAIKECSDDDEKSELETKADALTCTKRYLTSVYKWLTAEEVADKEYKLKKIIPAIRAKKEAQKLRECDDVVSYIVQSNIRLGEVCKISDLKDKLQSLFDNAGLDIVANKTLLNKFIKTNSKIVYSKDSQKKVSYVEDFSDTQTSFSFIEDIRSRFSIKKRALEGIDGVEGISLLFDVNRYLTTKDLDSCKGSITKAKSMIEKVKDRRIDELSSNRAIRRSIASTFSVDKRYTEKVFNREMSDITAGVDRIIDNSEYLSLARVDYDVVLDNGTYKFNYKQE